MADMLHHRRPRPPRSPPRPGNLVERTIGVFLLGLLLFNPPMLAVFDRAALVLGIPLLYLYLFVGWGLVIGAIALVTESGGADASFDDG